jgi:hypothetical protein
VVEHLSVRSDHHEIKPSRLTSGRQQKASANSEVVGIPANPADVGGHLIVRGGFPSSHLTRDLPGGVQTGHRLKNPTFMRGLLVLKTQYFRADSERVKN